jgi:hypothetical protein
MSSVSVRVSVSAFRVCFSVRHIHEFLRRSDFWLEFAHAPPGLAMKRKSLDVETRASLVKLLRGLKMAKVKLEELLEEDPCAHEFERRHLEGMRDNGEPASWMQCRKCGHCK